MNLNTTTDRYNNETHIGPLFPGAEERQFAYQDESIYRESMNIELCVWAHPPQRGDGKLNHKLTETKYCRYTLTIERHTGKAINLKLIAERDDIVEQRKAKGFAVRSDIVNATMSFGELINRIFSPGASVYHEAEAFPDSVKAAMTRAYPDAPRAESQEPRT